MSLTSSSPYGKELNHVHSEEREEYEKTCMGIEFELV